MLADILKEKSGNKYLSFGSTDEKKELLKNIMMFGMESKTKWKKYVAASLIIKKIT